MERRAFVAGLLASPLATAATVTGDDAAAVARFAAGRRFTDTPLGRIAYVEQGSGPTALFIHAWPLNGLEWRGVLPLLAGHRRCVLPDLLGLGYTESATILDVTPATQVDLLAALLDAKGVLAADLVANDSGGAVAQLFAAQYPQRVRSLLLTNCDAAGDNPPAPFQPLVALARRELLIDRFIRPQLANLETARSRRGLGVALQQPDQLSAAAVSYYLQPLVSSPRRQRQFNTYTISLGADVLSSIQPALRQLRAPVRIVWGTGDDFFSSSSPDVLNQTFPNSRGVRRVGGAKLYLPLDRPDIVATEALQLWQIADAQHRIN